MVVIVVYEKLYFYGLMWLLDGFFMVLYDFCLGIMGNMMTNELNNGNQLSNNVLTGFDGYSTGKGDIGNVVVIIFWTHPFFGTSLIFIALMGSMWFVRSYYCVYRLQMSAGLKCIMWVCLNNSYHWMIGESSFDPIQEWRISSTYGK